MSDLSAVEAIFCAALERPTPEARASYLDAACPNTEVRRQVERLLAADPGLPGPSAPSCLRSFAQRSDLNAARISVANNSGSSQAAKWPPLPASLK